MSKPPVAYVYQEGEYGNRRYRIMITNLALNELFCCLRQAVFLKYKPAQAIANTIKQFAKDQAKKKKKESK